MTGQHVRFSLVDVFACEPLNGNPLMLVVDAQELSQETMQRTAREFNQSETTFLLLPTKPEADWRLRSFTPRGAEVFGDGHIVFSRDSRLPHQSFMQRNSPLTR